MTDQFINDRRLNPVNGVGSENSNSVVREQCLKVRKGAAVKDVELFVSIGQRWMFHERDIDALNGFEVCHGHTEEAPIDR